MERSFEQQLQGFQALASQEAMKPSAPEEQARVAQERAEALATHKEFTARLYS